MTARARDGLPEVRRVSPRERARLAGSFGAVLRLERGGRSVHSVADAAEMNPVTVRRLEAGHRRPTTSSVWRLAKALRAKGTLRDQVALDERLRTAAGESLVVANTRPHRRRERVRAQLREEAAEGAVLGDHGEGLGAVVASELDRRVGTREGDSDRQASAG